jgi:hypothetical protein
MKYFKMAMRLSLSKTVGLLTSFHPVLECRRVEQLPAVWDSPFLLIAADNRENLFFQSNLTVQHEGMLRKQAVFCQVWSLSFWLIW